MHARHLADPGESGETAGDYRRHEYHAVDGDPGVCGSACVLADGADREAEGGAGHEQPHEQRAEDRQRDAQVQARALDEDREFRVHADIR